eukprot:5072078-Pleurochrysis_carterae.AAC.1
MHVACTHPGKKIQRGAFEFVGAHMSSACNARTYGCFSEIADRARAASSAVSVPLLGTYAMLRTTAVRVHMPFLSYATAAQLQPLFGSVHDPICLSLIRSAITSSYMT